MAVNYSGICFITMAPGVNFVKLFWLNLSTQWHNLSQNFRQYADSSVNYAKKSFVQLATVVNIIKCFFFITGTQGKTARVFIQSKPFHTVLYSLGSSLTFKHWNWLKTTFGYKYTGIFQSRGRGNLYNMDYIDINVIKLTL